MATRLRTLEPFNSTTRFGTVASEDTATTSNASSSPLRRINEKNLERTKILEKEPDASRTFANIQREDTQKLQH